MGLSNCVNIPLPISHSISTHSHAAKSKSSTTLSVLNNSQNLVISWIPEKPLLALKRWRPNSAHTWTPVACIAQIFKLVVREQQISENLPSLSWANPKMITSQFQNYLLKWVQHELLGPKSPWRARTGMKNKWKWWAQLPWAVEWRIFIHVADGNFNRLTWRMKYSWFVW